MADLSRDHRLRRVDRDRRPTVYRHGRVYRANVGSYTLGIYTSRGKDAHTLGRHVRLHEAKLAGHHIQSLKTPDGMALLDAIDIACNIVLGKRFLKPVP
jgi:hypothetical protein